MHVPGRSRDAVSGCEKVRYAGAKARVRERVRAAAGGNLHAGPGRGLHPWQPFKYYSFQTVAESADAFAAGLGTTPRGLYQTHYELTPHFTLSVQCRLASSHILPGCPPCDRLHGHTWIVRAFWSFAALDEHGMGANFRDLKDVLRREVHDRYDHRHLNDLPPFDTVPPTAENLAREVFLLLRERFQPGPRGRLIRVEVWEGPEACAAYEE